MTIQELTAKDFAGFITHPVCVIDNCRDDDLHDIILTKDGGVHLVCETHRREYTETMQQINVDKYKRLRDSGISAFDFCKTCGQPVE